ncbi:MAG: methyl-accepting chemotaxis protein [Xenococcaceae cyanobacterium MO_188.B32]|nr:methyl-accepting chemotaxis protein [Xenococcaceae cyanobacterium MO_188.B32]
MASGTNYSQEYGQAEKAYLQGDFSQAAEIIDRLAEEFPDNPNVLLLRGHIYCYGFQDYDLAQRQYEAVLKLTEEQNLLDFAYSGIEQIKQLQQQSNQSESESNSEEDWISSEFLEEPEIPSGEFESNQNYGFGLDDFELGEEQVESENEEQAVDRPDSFGYSLAEENSQSEDLEELNTGLEEDPFAQFEESAQERQNFDYNQSADDIEFPKIDETELSNEANNYGSISNKATFMVEEDDEKPPSGSNFEDFSVDNSFAEEDNSSEVEVDTVFTEPFAVNNYEQIDSSEQEGLDYQDELEFDEIDSSFFDLEELEQGLPDTGLFNVPDNDNSVRPAIENANSISPGENLGESANVEANVSSDLDTISATDGRLQVEIRQGIWAGFINAPIRKKQLIAASTTGMVSALATLIIATIGISFLQQDAPEQNLAERMKTGGLIALVAGLTSFSTSMLFGSMTARQTERATKDLQNQFEDVYQGNLNAKATVYSEDELGQLASGFNRMTRVILTTTQEAQRRAEETEQAKEDLQRQVIRLLDDVEGAARGDLTVQATVTADVLGAVADAFNLTIQSLREIVRQVKQAAEQVNKSSTDSELFARNQSSEALRMAEELAVTLNSVQMMTESIERVADNAREAEEVARSSSVTALKGGKAVDRTVSGIFQIRETVSETARKVKRLAEASQEISKIVLIISQISDRTNQLALNASIQAAKAGEAGRGFAVVADEVRQLADRSGKSLKEIEQIVLQIQSETGSVMTAMEEGIQEVIDVTDRAEQAKTALEDIIQVSNRIDTLVRSITADTVEQRENSRAVAQVMQSVELTAQATSQESQRVAGSLQSLVSIARDLLSSVERFRIDHSEE